MNEELEPLGLPTPPAGDQARTLAELVAQNPMVALAAAAAAGAGVMALVVATQRRDGASHPQTSDHVNGQVTQMYGELRSQLGKLASRLNDALPSKQGVAQGASDLGEEASKMFETTVDAAKRSIGGAAAAGKDAAQTAMAHPLLTSLVVGALGALVASLVPHADGSSSGAPASET